ncbi:MAG: hypothetical protein ACKN85_15230 [Pirellula sp.]|jgi:hypothetical protein|nr:hypothetical protein [Planctomycetota bacterium]
MSNLPSSSDHQVDLLLKNAQLRDELEPFLDESVDVLNGRALSLEDENEFLESILEWERAPSIPISKWFEPELKLPAPECLDDQAISNLLRKTIQMLYSQKIALDFTDHLSDRQLYCLLMRDILPVYQKKVSRPRNFLHWHCLDDNDVDCWLTFYATDQERGDWEIETGLTAPQKRLPPYPRQMPRRPGNFN